MSSFPWEYSLADRRFVIDAWNAGLNVRTEIAPALGRTKDSVVQFIHKLQMYGVLERRYPRPSHEWEPDD